MRSRKWIPRHDDGAPKTIAQVHADVSVPLPFVSRSMSDRKISYRPPRRRCRKSASRPCEPHVVVLCHAEALEEGRRARVAMAGALLALPRHLHRPCFVQVSCRPLARASTAEEAVSLAADRSRSSPRRARAEARKKAATLPRGQTQVRTCKRAAAQTRHRR